MAQMTFSLLVLSLTILGFLGTVESRSRARTYIEAQCRTTLYFDLCVKTLLPYPNKNDLPSPQKLAQISLTTCLAKTRFTKAYVDMVAKQLNKTKNPGEYQALEDCLRQINNGVNQITLSVKELQEMGKDGEEKFSWHESNVQSWVSAALTDATTCMDGILGDEIGSKTKSMIKARFLNVKQLASNSIALFSRFTARHRASRAIKNP
ncbi:putative pectinesterase [Helianthus annuus]|uniref:Pectinesterase n=1 Tax=Helianthus annuus TaxID=4232 RepID=A0A251SWS1_HELAN|nr:pectinesterase inhibitor 9 [Helianthus annuus]KAF5775523.1 putative pectinesterase [Helianthus annuus]KAJ0478630.1 putative pectinesterase [Helianthus annuus]KAJ0499514.1 putative pectinesterase [Helianthus annuus]KAJ0672975.1 putative pectinesterase [Helianthus annuus]